MRDSSPMMSQRLMNLGKEARIEPLVDGNLHFTAAAFQRTPNRAYSAPTSALIACAAAISDLEPAALPFLDLAKPRPYNALGSLASRFSAASKSGSLSPIGRIADIRIHGNQNMLQHLVPGELPHCNQPELLRNHRLWRGPSTARSIRLSCQAEGGLLHQNPSRPQPSPPAFRPTFILPVIVTGGNTISNSGGSTGTPLVILPPPSLPSNVVLFISPANTGHPSDFFVIGANWDTGSTPSTSQTAEILALPNGAHPLIVQLETSGNIGGLIIGAGVILQITNGARLTVANGIQNAGMIEFLDPAILSPNRVCSY
jgi:hypothetical protein